MTAQHLFATLLALSLSLTACYVHPPQPTQPHQPADPADAALQTDTAGGEGPIDTGARDAGHADAGGWDAGHADAGELDAAGDDASSHSQDSAVAPDVAPPEEWGDPVPLEATNGFRRRQDDYLAHCHEQNAPGGGSIYGQSCRVVMGGPDFNDSVIDAAVKLMEDRLDTADFRLAGVVRMIYLNRTHNSLPEETKDKLQRTLLNFKYWLDEPGEDKMCYWTENHQILFHSGQLLAGQLYPDTVFTNSGMSGRDHMEAALPKLRRWLARRLRFGFSEWHSNVYFNEDIPALVNLVDFAEDESIRKGAAIVLDLLAYDMLNNYFKGTFATVYGRTYENRLLGGLSDSTSDAAWIMLGLGAPRSSSNFSASFLATSVNYFPAQILEELARQTQGDHLHRQRDGIAVAEGPNWGIGYVEPEDIIFWAGMAALVAPQVIEGTVAFLDRYNLWNGFLFGDLPPLARQLLNNLRGTPMLEQLAWQWEPVTRGIALEGMDTYTYRTPHYQLSGAQDYNPGLWGAQTHMWQATLDAQAYVFTSFPPNLGELGDMGVSIGSQWVGGWLPRVTLHRSVGVIQYRRQDVDPLIDDHLSAPYLHAYFPKHHFDRFHKQGNILFGQKGDAYLALASREPLRSARTELNTPQWIADGDSNIWVVQMGSIDEFESFDHFITAVSNARLQFGKTTHYMSPTEGLVQVGWEGPMTINGVPANLGPYPRWSNRYGHTPFGSQVVTIQNNQQRLVLDVNRNIRALRRNPTE